MLFSFLQPNVSHLVVTEVSVSDQTSASVKRAISALSVNERTGACAEWPGQVFLTRSLTWRLTCWISQVTSYSFWDGLSLSFRWAFRSCHEKRETVLPLHTPATSFPFGNLKAISRNVQVSACMLARFFHMHSQPQTQGCITEGCFVLFLISTLWRVLCTEVPLQIDHRVSYGIRRYSFTFREISVCDY